MFALSGALCYGELGAKFPAAGGEYLFLRQSFGELPAFISGWISLVVGFSAPIAAAAMAMAKYGASLFPGDFPSLPLSPGAGKMVGACTAILVFSLAHYFSVKLGKGVQNLLTLFKLALILGFVGAGIFLGQGSWDHFSPAGSVPGQGLPGLLTDSRFAVALVFVTFAYTGWNAAAYLGGEILAPEKNLPRALITGTLIVTGLYLALNAVYVFALPPGAMAGVPDVGARTAAALFGPGAGRLFSGAVGLGLASALSAMIVTGPRVYYAMARDGLFFKVFARISSGRGTPGPAIFFQGALAMAMVVTASFEHLLIYIGFTLSLMSIFTVLGMICLRRRETGPARGYRTPGYPFTPLFFAAGNLLIIIFSLSGRPLAAASGLATIAMGLPFYLFFKKTRRARGPALLPAK